MGFVRGGHADPREALGRRVALGSVAGIEEGVEAQHAIVRFALPRPERMETEAA
ncbi:hypothetical protein [Piscinibacter sp.]|uniref:hypothetical protein n=1 Tax=Piscinibacter sp. TaxID=1903157 RepID=UPI0025D52742|nr:hypothetical protein [Piscinibacter sp.]